MDDLIRRSEAIEVLENTDWYHQNANKDMVSGANSNEHQAWYKADDVYRALESVPSTQPEQHWIPCSERMPDEGRECWITAKTTEEVYMGIYTEVYGIRHNVGFIYNDGFMWWNEAKAWMYCEKPEPYKGDEHEGY